MNVRISQNQYCRFGTLKRFLMENDIDISNKIELQSLQLLKEDFSDSYSFLCDEELRELRGEKSFWTEIDYESTGHNEEEYNFQVPVEKFNSTYYSHYEVIRSWFLKSEEIKKYLKKKENDITYLNENLFLNTFAIDNLDYFELVRKICGIEEKFCNVENNSVKGFFLYDISSRLQHPVLLITSSKEIEIHIPFYGFYSYFKADELNILDCFIAYISQNFQRLLAEVEQNHNLYMEEKYGQEFLKIKKHEMQYELKKQLEEQLIKRFYETVQNISPEIRCENQSFEDSIQFAIFFKKQRLVFKFNFEELQSLLSDNGGKLKIELNKILN